MKTLIAAILSLSALCNISNADQILIYRGIENVKANDTGLRVLHYYWLFDLTTSQYEGVEFGGSGTSAFYSTGSPAPFVYSPVIAPAGATRTYFAFGGSAETSGTFAIDSGYFTGPNTLIRISSAATAQFPLVLTAKSFALNGNGTLGVDTAVVDGGLYNFAPALTQQSNGSNDPLTGTTSATTIVTSFLKSLGFVSE